MRWFSIALVWCLFFGVSDRATAEGERRFLYVAVPGVRNYLEYGGHGLLVFDIDNGHRFVKRIATAGLNKNGQPLNVKGVCASAVMVAPLSSSRKIGAKSEAIAAFICRKLKILVNPDPDSKRSTDTWPN